MKYKNLFTAFFILLLTLGLLTGCTLAEASVTADGGNPEPVTAPSTAASSARATLPEPSVPVTEAPTEPETTQPDVGLAGTVMEVPEAFHCTPESPDTELVIRFPEVDLTGAPGGRLCNLRVELDGKELGGWNNLLLTPGTERVMPLTFSFSRYMATSALLTVTLTYGEESLTREIPVALENHPDEAYAALLGDPEPYSIQVLRDENLVVVYGKDQEGEYTQPVKVFVCSTGKSTPTGSYTLGGKKEWGALFGHVYGQYISRITGDILFHSVPYLEQDKGTLETEEFNKLGTSASLGCVRLQVKDVKWIYDYCPEGTPVRIYDAQGELPENLPAYEIPVTLDPEDPRSCWDPTDPDENNPWNGIDS